MWGILIALLSGALMSVQGVFNTELTKQTSLWVSTGWVQISAFLICVLAWLFTGRQEVSALARVDHKYLLLGGVIGAFITVTVIQSMSSLGPAKACLLYTSRELLREGRKRENIKTAAIVGYTNAGKSTLLNTLTDACVLEEDKLFATLDPTTRVLELPGKQKIYLTDTVGFIRKLPHHLIEAFKSTLEEAKYADFIIHVVDASNPQMEEQMYVVYETLQELGVQDKKMVTLFNKQDKLTDEGIFRDFKADYVIKTAVKTGQGLEELKKVLEKLLTEDQIYIERVLDYQEAGQVQLIRKYGQLISEEYTEAGIEIKARVPRDIYGKIGGK